MKKLYCALIIIIVTILVSGCNIFIPKDYPPEEIYPEIYLSGDITVPIKVNISELEIAQFDEVSGYPLSDLLDKATIMCDDYDILVVARNGKAIKIEGETVENCYFTLDTNGILQFNSDIHYQFINSFLPLGSVSEIIVMANNEVERGISVTGGTIEKLYVKGQIQLIFAELRTYISNNGYVVIEYIRETTLASKLLFNAYSTVEITLLNEDVITIDNDTQAIIDWENGYLVIRSNKSPITAIALDKGGTE